MNNINKSADQEIRNTKPEIDRSAGKLRPKLAFLHHKYYLQKNNLY